MTQPQTSNGHAALVAAGVYSAYQLRQEQDRSLAPLLKRVRQLFRLQGVPVTSKQRDEMVTYLWRPMNTARARNYQAAASYLRNQGIVNVPPLQEYRPAALDKLLQDTVDRVLVVGDPVTVDNRTSPLVVEQTAKSAARAASRHAQQPARETVHEAADESGAEIGWARVLTGARSCAFCAMLASRGPVFRSDKQALYRGGGSMSAYHDGCDCIAVLVREGLPWDGEDSYLKLNDLWQETGGRASGKAARNTFRRSWDKTVREGGSGDFIAESVQPPGGAR